MNRTSGYSGTRLKRKLDIKPGYRMCVIDPPANYWDLLGELPENVSVRELGEGVFDFIHVFARDRAQLEERIPTLRDSIVPNGALWVSWPKKASQVATDLSENVVRDLAVKNRLVDVKVAAVDGTWSGLKLVIRLRDRA